MKGKVKLRGKLLHSNDGINHNYNNHNNNDNNNTKYNEYITKKNSSFSSKLLLHGNWVDNSLDAATRSKQRMTMNEYRRHYSIDRINQSFSEEAENLLKLQQLLMIRQKKMAFTVIEKYSALSIQLCYRCFISRKRLFVKKMLRFLNDWLWGSYHRRKRQKARLKICSSIFYWYRHKCFSMMLLKVRKARQIQANVRRALTSYKFRQYRDFMRNVQTICKHIFLFGVTRAAKQIMIERDRVLENARRIIRNVVIRYRCRKRKSILKGPYGKFIFYFLEQKSMQSILVDFKPKPLVDKEELKNLSLADVTKAIMNAKKRKELEEEEIARDIVLYLKHKVDENIASKGNAAPPKSIVIDKGKIIVSNKKRMARKVIKPLVQSLSKPIELPNGVAVQLPVSWTSLFRMSSMYEAACLILDLLDVAMNDNSLVDDELPSQIAELNTPKPPTTTTRTTIRRRTTRDARSLPTRKAQDSFRQQGGDRDTDKDTVNDNDKEGDTTSSINENINITANRPPNPKPSSILSTGPRRTSTKVTYR